mgnify:CR=1 FL=1
MIHDIIVIVVMIVLTFVVGLVMYKIGYEEGKHVERMNTLDILGTIPMMTQLIVHSKTEYDSRYHSLYVVNYIIDKLKER